MNCPAPCPNAHPLRVDTVPHAVPRTQLGSRLQPHGLQTFTGCWAFAERQTLCGVAGLTLGRAAFPEDVLRTAANKRLCDPGTAWQRRQPTGGLRAPGMLPSESLPRHQAQTFVVIPQAARTWGNPTRQGSAWAGFSIHCFNEPLPQARLGTPQEPTTICVLQRSGETSSTSPALPDGPGCLHLETIPTSWSPRLTTALGNAASSTEPQTAAEHTATSPTSSPAGEATGKAAGRTRQCSTSPAPWRSTNPKVPTARHAQLLGTSSSKPKELWTKDRKGKRKESTPLRTQEFTNL